jgi:hypothetical protein
MSSLTAFGLYSETALTQEPFRIGHVHTHILLTVTYTDSSQNIELSSWDTLYTFVSAVMFLFVH